MRAKTGLLFLLLICETAVFAKNSEDEDFKPSISPFLKIQFWNLASQGTISGDEEAASRYASYFRRGRFGVKGKVLPELSYNLMLSFDNLGKDGFSSTKGVANAGTISVWSACFTYNFVPGNDWLNITGGYFLPHLSRESTTTPWDVSSLDKAENSCYLRQFVTGKANGVSGGMNLGGLGNVGKQTLLYNVAIVNRQDATSIMETVWSPVFLGHFMLNFGDKEFAKYKSCFSNNSLKKQTSATLGFGFSSQGETDVFQKSKTFSADATIYLGCMKLDGEYSHLYRKNETAYNANCFMARIGYNIFLNKKWVLEPTLMHEKFSGDENYEDASFFDGTDEKIDAGVNLNSIKKTVKINLHYVHHKGTGIKNRYTSNNSYPGDYISLGLQLII
jgi:hypothetical protein